MSDPACEVCGDTEAYGYGGLTIYNLAVYKHDGGEVVICGKCERRMVRLLVEREDWPLILADLQRTEEEEPDAPEP